MKNRRRGSIRTPRRRAIKTKKEEEEKIESPGRESIIKKGR